MKKTLLSLAALAFVVTGSVATVSCGDDNSTPVKPNPEPAKEQAQNTIRYNGTDSPLDFSYYELVTRDYNTQDGTKVERPSVYAYPDGGYANGYYVNVGYNLVNGDADTYHWAFVLVYNPSIVVQNNAITDFGTRVLPHQAEKMAWRSAFVKIGDKQFESAQGNIGEGELKVNTLVLDGQNSGTSSFESKFTLDSDNINVKYNEKTHLTTYKQQSSQRSAKATGKVAALEAVKSLEVSNVLVK